MDPTICHEILFKRTPIQKESYRTKDFRNLDIFGAYAVDMALVKSSFPLLMYVLYYIIAGNNLVNNNKH